MTTKSILAVLALGAFGLPAQAHSESETKLPEQEQGTGQARCPL